MKYTLLNGTTYDTAELSLPERALLEEVQAFYRTGPEWSQFFNFWFKRVQMIFASWPRQKVSALPIFQICQDLEARLGMAQGKVKPPDYREQLSQLIAAQYPDREALCRTAGLEYEVVERVLAGEEDVSMAQLQALLAALDCTLQVVPQARGPAAAPVATVPGA
jgi:hypothetical protein